MGWVNLLIAFAHLARELLKYCSAKEANKKRARAETQKDIEGLKDAIKLARETGDTSGIERAFRRVPPPKDPGGT